MVTEAFGARLELTPSGGAFWADQHAFLVADLHLGKGSSFRVLGQSPVPTGSTTATLAKLAEDLHRFQPRKLWILGDLWHRAEGCTPEVVEGFQDFLKNAGIQETLLIEGNHDVRTVGIDDQLGIQRFDRYQVAGISLIHEPCEGESPHFAGHIHPGVVLYGKGGQALKRPCFHLSEFGLVFPAYGDFTGSVTVDTLPSDRVYVLGEDQVHGLSGEDVLNSLPRPYRRRARKA